jgi:methionyl-tRNA formyltransferase
MGSPGFAVPALHALHETGHDIIAVYCQPPRPAGRGHAVRRCPVHETALALGLEVRTPIRLRRNEAEHAAFAALDLDAAVVAAYGLILPEPMLAAPRRGCLNIHASLLPRWRGAAPIQAAILAGDRESGVTIMQMDAGLDTGPMLLAETVPIGERTTASHLHDALAELGARLILRALDENPPPRAQPDDGMTYAPKLTREDGRIDWTRDAISLDRQVRALNPWPGTYTFFPGTMLKVLEAEPVEYPLSAPGGGEYPLSAPGGGEGWVRWGEPGTVLDDKLSIAAGGGVLRLTRVQAPGRAALDAAAFLRGHPIPIGARLG